MKRIIAVLITTAAAGGCALPTPADIQARRAERDADNVAREARAAAIRASTPTCKEARECEVKWSAARTWILQNAGMKLQHVTPDFLETFNPLGASASFAVRVQKLPQRDGSYRIEANIWCGNMFGCGDLVSELNSFNNTVNAAGAPSPTTPASLRVSVPVSPLAETTPLDFRPVQRPGIVMGQFTQSAEGLARDSGCAIAPVASVVAKGPGFETYTVACANGEALAIRCEMGKCRTLR